MMCLFFFLSETNVILFALPNTNLYTFLHFQLPGVPAPRHALLLLYTFIAYTAESSKVFILGETLCGGELVDTMQFVCGDRGFYFGKSTYSKYPSFFITLSSFLVPFFTIACIVCIYKLKGM